MSYQDRPALDPRQRAATLRSIELEQIKKATEHLLGICSGLIADSQINSSEILYLRTWLSDHAELVDEWPGRVIASRITEILDDGFITAAECQDLLQTLQEITRTDFANSGAAAPEGPALPIDDDPSIFFDGMTFCFTGRFLLGTRATCERAVMRFDGTCVDSITQDLDYLVIGSLIEPQWAHTTFGRKIEKAVRYRDDGHDIAIVSEQQWTAALEDLNARSAA